MQQDKVYAIINLISYLIRNKMEEN